MPKTQTKTTKKDTVKKAASATKVASAKVAPAKKVAAKAAPVKKSAPKKAAPKAAPAKKAKASEKADLFIVSNGRLLATRQFDKHISEVYGCEEYVWSGKLVPGSSVKFVTKSHQELPVLSCYNEKGGPGITLDGQKAIASFKVDSALSITSQSGEQVYNYMNDSSVVSYVGDDKAHTVYVRIYDDNNGRWLVINLD